ncbi:hypothetical protein [Leisingera aquaemixtae]|uniref:Uncharacterized protein n=1 Tax=Leisingera aquaemixtae TaxID=1396826 RepID=A0A0P1H623_9RHOB|nr:hypothetical protein [Leisingera aquaemixtae]UWQ27187.1 hypothetical protein K3553_20250 [Leisingera aquaemixtae]CUH98280.1 hypothetical protein PHA8399_00394 [Leisingera aquaemixtae]
MQDPELEILIGRLESQPDLTLADFDGVLHALAFLLPDAVPDDEHAAQRISTADGAMHVADDAFPDWDVHIRGRAYGKHGRWHCTLRENDARDNDAAIGVGQSPVLAQAILAAVLRLAMILKTE